MSQPSETQNLSRKQRRQQRNSPIPVENDRDGAQIITQRSADLAITSISQMASPIRLLVCSIGNPAPYLNTLHSAGHIVLSLLANSLCYPPFQKSRAHGNGLLSSGSEFTLWQSSSQMNVSGVGVAAAWRQFVKDARGEEARLVVVHDELELALGQVKVKSGAASAKGHNGLKSIKSSLGGMEYTRIGVGIGRPESREPEVVAGYVLRKVSGLERKGLEGSVGRVETELRRLMEG